MTKFIEVRNNRVSKLIPISRIKEIKWTYQRDRRIPVVVIDGDASGTEWQCDEAVAINLTIERIDVPPGFMVDGYQVAWIERVDGNDVTAMCWHADGEFIQPHEILISDTLYDVRTDAAIEAAADRAVAGQKRGAA